MKSYRINSSSKVNVFFNKILLGENYGDDGDDHTKINEEVNLYHEDHPFEKSFFYKLGRLFF